MSEMSVQQWIDKLPEYFIAEKADGIDATVQLHLTGEGGGDWAILIHNKKIEAVAGEVSNPRLVMSGDAQDVLQVLSGKMDGMKAFMLGKFKVQGDVSLGMKMVSMFRQP